MISVWKTFLNLLKQIFLRLFSWSALKIARYKSCFTTCGWGAPYRQQLEGKSVVLGRIELEGWDTDVPYVV
jgi:hypothetical protein